MTLQLTGVDLSGDDINYDWYFAGNPACPACDEPIQAYGPIRHRTATVDQHANGATTLTCDCGWTCEVAQ